MAHSNVHFFIKAITPIPITALGRSCVSLRAVQKYRIILIRGNFSRFLAPFPFVSVMRWLPTDCKSVCLAVRNRHFQLAKQYVLLSSPQSRPVMPCLTRYDEYKTAFKDTNYCNSVSFVVFFTKKGAFLKKLRYFCRMLLR